MMLLKSLTRTSAISYMHKYKFVVSFVFYKSLLVLIYYHFCVFIYYLFKVIFCKPCCETPFIHTSWLDVILKLLPVQYLFLFCNLCLTSSMTVKNVNCSYKNTNSMPFIYGVSFHAGLAAYRTGVVPRWRWGRGDVRSRPTDAAFVLLATHFCCICSFYLCYVCDLSTSAYLCY